MTGPKFEPPVLPEGWILDPKHADQPYASINAWYVITNTGMHICWNAGREIICPVCNGTGEPPHDGHIVCPECKSVGHVDHIPWADRPWDEVMPNLWIGGHFCQLYGSVDGLCFPGQNFTHVVSLHREADARFKPGHGVEHVYYEIDDDDTEELDAAHRTGLDELADAVWWAVWNGEKVLVRCAAGLNRSGLLTGLVLLRFGKSAEEAMALMRKVRSPYVLINHRFAAYLQEAEARMRGALPWERP